MKFCPDCSRVLLRDTSSGKIMFNCTVCKRVVPGDENDARIASAILGAGENARKYEQLLQNAAFDPVNQQVRRDCDKCGRDYQTMIRVGDDEQIVYVCRCGARSSGTSSSSSSSSAAAVKTSTSSEKKE